MSNVLYDHHGDPIKSIRQYKREGWSQRRFESAQTDRLNSAMWQDANGNTINLDLSMDWKTLCRRTAYERANNGIVKGMVETHATDIAGPNGPTLQIVAIDADNRGKAYAANLESIFKDWWAEPDIAGIMDGPQFLHLWIRQLHQCGEFVNQITTDPEGDPDIPVSMRLQALRAERVDTPPEQITNPNIVLGIEREKTGRPRVYWLNDAPESTYIARLSKYRPIAARDVVHRFVVEEPGQARGVPWLGCALQRSANMRDMDKRVLEAARMAAMWAVMLYSDHPDIEPIVVNETTELESGVMSTLPPGWKAEQMDPKQPAVNYVQYRKEVHGDVGRGINMPGMMVRLDSSGHNYSSARFDAQVYHRSNRVIQGWLERRTLNKLVAKVEREAQLARKLNRVHRPRMAITWTWPRPPHVDPLKEANAQDIRLNKSKVDTLIDALNENGTDIETYVAKLKRVQEVFADAGIDPAEFSPSVSGSVDDAIRQLFEKAIAEHQDELQQQETTSEPA